MARRSHANLLFIVRILTGGPLRNLIIDKSIDEIHDLSFFIGFANPSRLLKKEEERKKK